MNQSNVDSTDILTRAMEKGYLLVEEQELPTGFFKLSNGIAGDLLQKAVNYQLRLAIVVTDESRHGDRVTELVREHHSHSMVRFFRDTESAKTWLSQHS